MSPRSSSKQKHKPGIYDLEGTMHGERALIAYDARGEVTIRLGENAYAELVIWLRARGITVTSSRPALFLV